MSSIIAPGKDFTLTFLQWPDILFSSMPDAMESTSMSVVFLLHLWWISLSKLMFLAPLSDFISCCLVALNAVWYCWRISFSWWSNLALLICSCSCCCVSGDKLLFSLHWLLTSSLTVIQFWKFSKICLVEVSEGAAVNYSFAIFNWFLFWANWKSIRTDRFINVASFFRSSFNLQTFTREICLVMLCGYTI